MRIVHVTDGYPPRMGGIEMQVRDLANRQVLHGHHVEVVTGVAGDDVEGDNCAVRVHRPPGTHGSPGRISWSHTAAGVRAIVAGDFDVVHAHLSVASPLAVAAIRRGLRAGMAVAATVHSVWNPPISALMALAISSSNRRSGVAWSAVSEVAAASTRSAKRVDVRVIPNGIDSQWWRDGAIGYRGPDGPLRVLTTMRLVRRKRPIPLLRILRQVNQHSPGRVQLTIVGDGPLAGSVAAWAGRKSMPTISMAGPLARTQLHAQMSEHDIYVAPARLESFGIAALEARCAGLPVLALRRSGIGEFITDGLDGYLASSDRALAGKLHELVADTDHVARLRRHTSAKLPQLGWDVTLDGYEQLYAQALERAHTHLSTH